MFYKYPKIRRILRKILPYRWLYYKDQTNDWQLDKNGKIISSGAW